MSKYLNIEGVRVDLDSIVTYQKLGEEVDGDSQESYEIEIVLSNTKERLMIYFRAKYSRDYKKQYNYNMEALVMRDQVINYLDNYFQVENITYDLSDVPKEAKR